MQPAESAAADEAHPRRDHPLAGRWRRCRHRVYRMHHEVTDIDTAVALGSGDVPVLATPRLIAWMEAATVRPWPPSSRQARRPSAPRSE